MGRKDGKNNADMLIKLIGFGVCPEMQRLLVLFATFIAVTGQARLGSRGHAHQQEEKAINGERTKMFDYEDVSA